MRVGFFRKILVMFRLAVVNIVESSKIIIGSFFSKNKRACYDRIMHSWARNILNVVRVKYKNLNPDAFEFEKKRSYVIMSNHTSHFDIPLIFTAFPNDSVAMLAKKELFKIPIFGRAIRLAGCVSIDRKNKRQAIKDLKVAKEAMLGGIRLWVAPEGTRSPTGEMGKFKKGGFKVAMATNAVIVPVTISGSNKILPTKTLDFSLDVEVDVYVGKPIDTSQYSSKDINKLMEDTMAAIKLNLVQTEENKNG